LESGLTDPVIKTKKKVFPGGAGPGRPKGLGNKSTGRAREAIARFVDGNAERLEGWLDEIAEQDGPMAAFKCFADVLEYHVPKLARTEIDQTTTHEVGSSVKDLLEAVGETRRPIPKRG
jgi:hypothetical protein